MRNLFIVLAKVVGLLQIPTILNKMYIFILFIGDVGSKGGGWMDRARDNYLSFFAFCFDTGLFLALTWVLLFQTNRIADRVGLFDGKILWPQTDSLLYAGIKVLGLFFLVGAIPSFISALFNTRAYNPDNAASYFWVRIQPGLLKMLFGFLLVLKTTKIIELISRDSKPKEAVSA